VYEPLMSTVSPEVTQRRLPRFVRVVSVDMDRVKNSAPFAALLMLTGVLYLWGLSRNGYANEYYAAAVQAGSHSWKAFLFGSLDAANYITVDKPPASLWLMELSSRVFGFSSFSMLLPQALEGVAAVALLYSAVRRWFGRPAALLSGVVLALTPVAALMFRFNNPDALLVLLLVAGAYCLTRALESGSTRWLALAGSALGFAFLTKELQAFLVLPAFALVYLAAAPVPVRRRLWQLVVAGAALVASAGWWIALVELWPASARPYIGGSTDNSIVQLIFGYNGLERISSGGGGFGSVASGFSGPAGVLRLFNPQLGGQISWLLPAAAIAVVTGGVWTARRPRTDRARTAWLLWGGWLIVSAAVYSFMTGIIHPYYTNTLAPAIAVLVGVVTARLWQRREQLSARLILAAMLAVTAVWSYVLLGRAPEWHPWLRVVILAAGVAIAVLIVVHRAGPKRRWGLVLATAGLMAGLAGPTAYTLSTVATSESGPTASAGPAVASAVGFPPGGRAASRLPVALRVAVGGGGTGGTPNRALVSLLERNSSRYTWVAATSSATTAASLELATGKSVMAIGGFIGSDPSITLAHFKQLVAQGKIHYYAAGGPGGGFGGGPGGFAFGRGGEFRPPAGGFAGGNLHPPSGGFTPGGFGRGERSTASRIEAWVAAHFTSTTVGATKVYDLTQPKGG
jgi:4-amino-4-deoxy-L-arabinose transferase-like glycosyltransferase